jgi:UPF0176 protein
MTHLHNRVEGKVLKEKLAMAENVNRTTLSFYKYHNLSDPGAFRNELYQTLDSLEVMGRIYVAHEGINGQISVPTENLETFKTALYSISFLAGIRLNIAVDDDGKSFFKLKILVRKKIVADGLNDETFDATNSGVHLNAEDFNKLAEDKDTVIVDMRNHYESEVGHFKNAICPDVDTFRDSLPVVENMLADQKDKNVIMYCTGGIRCEKASAWMKHKGFKKVFQLNGGIIEYARQVKDQNLENKFIGKNFVFDERLGERISMTSSAPVINAVSLAMIIPIARTMAVICCSFNAKNALKNLMVAAQQHVKRPYCFPLNSKRKSAKALIKAARFSRRVVRNTSR